MMSSTRWALLLAAALAACAPLRAEEEHFAQERVGAGYGAGYGGEDYGDGEEQKDGSKWGAAKDAAAQAPELNLTAVESNNGKPRWEAIMASNNGKQQ